MQFFIEGDTDKKRAMNIAVRGLKFCLKVDQMESLVGKV
jgi:hypothetical protein